MTPQAVWAFGSFARGEADADSDIDVVMVRPADVGAEDDLWGDAVQQWKRDVNARTGNRIDVIEATGPEIAEGMLRDGPLWTDIARERLVVFGADVDAVVGSVDA